MIKFESKGQWRQWQKSRPLLDLIERPNCGRCCLDEKDKYCDCGSNCKKVGFTRKEWDDRFTIRERSEIIRARNAAGNYYRSEVGCVLPRRLRPRICLEYICPTCTKDFTGD